MIKKISIIVFIILSAYGQCIGQAGSSKANQFIETTNSLIIPASDSNILPPKQTAGKTTFDFDPNNDLILLPVSYKDKQLLFFLDTGASITAFDIAFEKELGNPKKTVGGITAGGKTALPVYNAPEAYLGPYNLKDYNEVLCTDMTMLSFVAGEKISGIIGMNFLKKHCVQIDADNSKLTIYNSPLERTDNLGQQFSLKFDRDIPFLYSSIDGIRQTSFLIDLGADSDIMLQTNEFENLVKNKKLQTTETLAETATGTVKARLSRLDRFQLGQYEYKDLLLEQGVNNILGLQFMARHLVTMDFPNEKIYFKKGENFSHIYQSDMSGLHLLKIDGNITVYSVDKGSPAETAGIKSHDVIVSVQGKEAGQFHITQIRDILSSEDGKKISLTIKRGDQTQDVVVTLKKKI